MGVIVTRHTGSGSASASGSGAYSQLEKLANEMEMEFKSAYLCYYKELTYNNKKQLTNVGIWTSSSKILKLFNKDLSYNPQKQLIQTDLIRISDGILLISVFAYNNLKQLISITRSGTACPSSSSSSSSISSSSSSVSSSSSSSSLSSSSSSSSLSSSSSSSSLSSSSSSSSLSSSSSSSSLSSSSSSSSLSSSSSSSSSSLSSSSSSSSSSVSSSSSSSSLSSSSSSSSSSLSSSSSSSSLSSSSSSSSSSLSSSSSSLSSSSSSSSSSLSSSSSSSSSSVSSSSSSLSSSSSSSSSSLSSSSSSSSLSSSSSSSSLSSSSSSSSSSLSSSSSSSSSSVSSSSSSSSSSLSSSSSSVSSSSSSSSSSVSSSSSSSSSSISSSSSSESSSSSSSSSSESSSSSSSSSSESSSSSSSSSSESSSSSRSFAFVEDPDTDAFDPNSKNYRIIILDTELTNSGDETLTRVLFRGHSSQDVNITGASIQKRKDEIEDYLTDPIRLTFSGEPSASIQGGIDVWSDWVTFSVLPSADHLIHVFQAGSPHYYKTKTKTSATYIKQIGQDHTLTVTISGDGYTLDNKHYHVVAIDTSSSSSSSSVSSSSSSSRLSSSSSSSSVSSSSSSSSSSLSSSSLSSSSLSSSSTSSSSSSSSSSVSSSSVSSSSVSWATEGALFTERFDVNAYPLPHPREFPSPGYTDNEWILDYNLGGGGVETPDADYPTAAITGAGLSWGAECFRGDVDEFNTSRWRSKDGILLQGTPTIYFRGEYSMSTGTWDTEGQEVELWRFLGYSTVVAYFTHYYDGSNHKVAAYIYHDGNSNLYISSTTVTAGNTGKTKIEFKWDLKDATWEWKVDGNAEDDGTITSSATSEHIKYVSFGSEEVNITVFYVLDNMEYRDDYYPSSFSSSSSSESSSSSSESSSSSSFNVEGLLFSETFDENLYQTSNVTGLGDNLYTYNYIEGSPSFVMNYSTGDVSGAPNTGWGSEIFRYSFSDSIASYLTKTLSTGFSLFYFRIDFIWQGNNPLNSPDLVEMLKLITSSDDPILKLDIAYDNGSISLLQHIYAADGQGPKYSVQSSLQQNTFYWYEMYWDILNEQFASKLNGVSKESGSITGASLPYRLNKLSFGPTDRAGVMSSTSYLVYADIEIRDDDWIGPAGSFSSSSLSSSSISSSSESTIGDNFFDDNYWEALTFSGLWDAGNNEWDVDPFIFGDLIKLLPIGTWSSGYTNNTMRITVDNISNGSSTFEITLEGAIIDANVTGIALSDGQSYDLDISSVDADFISFEVINEGGGQTDFSITDITFFV